MKERTLEDVEKYYDLELDKVVENIKKSKAKLVLLQFADGLKQYSTSVVDHLREKTNNKVEFLIWFGDCFGACDYPVGLDNLKPKIDLMVQFGHSDLMPSY